MTRMLLLLGCCLFACALFAQKPAFDSLLRIDSREIYFDFASAALKAEADSLLQVLYDNYTKRKADSIYITAHTDSVGNMEQNLRLSKDRAQSVHAKLRSLGVPDSVLRIQEFGESQPAATNETEEGRQRNRRATIDIYKKIKMTLLTGKLLDETNQQGIVGNVNVSTLITQANLTTDTSGRFQTSVPVGAVIKLQPSADGYAVAKDSMFKPKTPVQPYIELALKPLPKPKEKVVPTIAMIPLKGQLVDPKTGKPLQGSVTIETSQGRKTLETDENGNFEMQVPAGENVLVEPLVKNFSLEPIKIKSNSINADPVQITPKPIEPGDAITLRHMHFYNNEAVLMEDSEPELEKLFRYLQLNNDVKVEIAGHVDIGWAGKAEKGSTLYQLSEKRAAMVYNYLVEKGINRNRLTHKGYGNDALVYEYPETDEEHKANRRVEIRILSTGNSTKN